MDNLRIFHDVEGKTLTVWFSAPESEASCEETGDEVILIKNQEGRVIGFEKLNFLGQPDRKQIKIEAIAAS